MVKEQKRVLAPVVTYVAHYNVNISSSQTGIILKLTYLQNYKADSNQILHCDKDHQMLRAFQRAVNQGSTPPLTS